MTVHHARILGVAAVLVGICSLGPSTRLQSQQPLADLPLDEVRVLAEQGDAAAQFTLGVMYADGRGVSQDDAEAVRWYRLAADQGNADAQYNLGVRSQDDAEAVRWYRLAADQGDAGAQNNLGARYGNGKGVPQDDAEAVRWYRLAADQGNATAQNNLGVAYANGRGTRRPVPSPRRLVTS